MMHATKSTSRASSSTSTSPETSSDFFPLFFCWSHYDSDGCGDQVLHLLLLRPNHAHLLPWLALQHLNEGAQRGTDDNDVSDNLVGPSAVIVYILNLNCCARRLAPCWSSSSRSTLSTSDSRLRSPRWSHQILYFYVSYHHQRYCQGVLHHLLWRLGVLLCPPHLLCHLGVDGAVNLKAPFPTTHCNVVEGDRVDGEHGEGRDEEEDPEHQLLPRPHRLRHLHHRLLDLCPRQHWSLVTNCAKNQQNSWNRIFLCIATSCLSQWLNILCLLPLLM